MPMRDKHSKNRKQHILKMHNNYTYVCTYNWTEIRV